MEYGKENPRRNLSLPYSIGAQCFTAHYSTSDCFTDDCPQHKAQLDACHQAMTELDALFKGNSNEERLRLQKKIMDGSMP